MKEIGIRIKDVIETKSISKTDFANTLNISQAYVSKIINKGSVPSARLIEDICEKFHVNEDWLRNGNGEMFYKLSKKDAVILWANTVLDNESVEFRDRFIDALFKLDAKDWELLANMAETLASQKEKD